MILAHYSAQPIYKFDMSVHKPRERDDYFKPAGLWVSVDDAEDNWQDWCCGEDFGLDRFAYRTEVTLKDGHNILFIKSVPELDAFHAKYGFDILAGSRQFFGDNRMDWLKWPDVKAAYDGIIITPYQWARRLPGPMWYYAWDCASGCIWNGEAVTLKASEPFDIDDYSKRMAESRDETEQKEQVQSG